MLRSAIAILMVMLLWPSAAQAEKRVALVIGNGLYAKVGKLSNPTHDADAIEILFRKAGFDVVQAKRDLGLVAMRRTLRDFSDQARDADIAAVFFAGHGIEVNGTNYLIPVDATLERDIDVEDETVSLERVTQILEQVKRLRLVILDACRDNPFVRSMKRTVAGRSIGRGLAEVRVLTSDTLIAFAAKAGSTAADGQGTNSPYTAALVKHVATPGLDLRLALGRVRDEVLKSTGNRQEPFVYGSLGGTEIALVGNATQQPQPGPQPKAPDTASEAERAWPLVKDTSSVAALEAFITRYKDTFFADLARARLSELTRPETMPTRPDSAAKEIAPAPQRRSHEAIRDALYRTIMEHLSQRRSSRNQEQTSSENYRDAPRPKAMAVCIDWTKTTPTLLNSGERTGAYSDRGNTGCRGFSSEQCGRYTRDRCRDRGLCSIRGQECVLVDINGRNALTLNEVWAKKFMQSQ